MKTIWNKAIVSALTGLFVLAAAGCGGGGDKEAARKEILKVGAPVFADNLDPVGNAAGWTVIRYGVGETLGKFDRNMQVIPWLAESWKPGSDKLTWTFTINGNAKFSNGHKVTAEAVKSSFERTLSRSAEAKNWSGIESMQAEGQTLKIRTAKPVAGLPGVLCDPRFTVIDTSVKDRDIMKMGPVCTGPYMVKSFSREKAVLEANPNYWDGPVPFKGLEIPAINDPVARAMALQKGEVDVAADISSGDLALFKDSQKYRVSEISSLRSVLARLNMRQGKPLSDKKIREALTACLDRSGYCKVLLRDTFVPGGPVLAPALGYGYEELIKLPACQRDVEKSKKLLKEAGYKDTNGDGIVDKDGKNLVLDFAIYTSRAELPLFAEAVKSDARKVGIQINVKAADYTAVEQLGKTGNWDMLISDSMTIRAGSPAHYLDMYWRSGHNGNKLQNSSGYSNPEYDALSDGLAMEPDPEKQKHTLIAMQKILLEDTAAIVFGYPKTNIISRAEITGADIMPCDYYWITRDWKRKAAPKK